MNNAPSMMDKRKDLRAKQTPEEALLWCKLRNKQLEGFKFRRQHSVGGYILDFYCPEKKIAIELDGFHHLEPLHLAYDEYRSDFLLDRGIIVLRFMNDEVTTDIDTVIVKIAEYLITI